MKIFRQICFISLTILFTFNPQASGQDVDSEISKLATFRLRHADSREVAPTIERLYASQDSGIRIAVDQRSNLLIVTADDPAKLDVFRALVNEIDVAASEPEKTEAKMLELTAMLVIEGGRDIMQEIPAPSNQVLNIITEMEKNPYLPVFEDPRVGSVLMNRVMLSHEVKTKGANAVGIVHGTSSSRGGLCELQLSGKVSEIGSGQYRLETDISLRLKTKLDEAYSSKISTEVAITKEHPVILGLTSIDGVNCLVIVEVR